MWCSRYFRADVWKTRPWVSVIAWWIESLCWKWFLCDSLWMLLLSQGRMDRPMNSWLGDLHPRKLEVDLGQWCFSLPKKTCCHISICCIYACTFSTHRGRESVNVVYTQVSTFVIAITCWFLIWLRGDKSLHGSLFMTAPWSTKNMGTGRVGADDHHSSREVFLVVMTVFILGQMLLCITRWWFQIFFIFTPTWGRFPIWLIFFKGVETTNQIKYDIVTSFLGLCMVVYRLGKH